MSNSIQVISHKTDVIKATAKQMKKAARMIGGSAAGHASEAAPRNTGLLANSITFALGGEPAEKQTYQSDSESAAGKRIEQTEGHYEGQADQDENGQVTVYVGTNVQYAPYQELGAPNANVPARPFLRPAFENNQDEFKQIIEQCLKELD